jgi:hypothetical protein
MPQYWRKEYALTRGGLGIDSVSMSREVSRVVVVAGKRAAKKIAEASQGDEG